jgi:hypothetical protein
MARSGSNRRARMSCRDGKTCPVAMGALRDDQCAGSDKSDRHWHQAGLDSDAPTRVAKALDDLRHCVGEDTAWAAHRHHCDRGARYPRDKMSQQGDKTRCLVPGAACATANGSLKNSEASVAGSFFISAPPGKSDAHRQHRYQHQRKTEMQHPIATNVASATARSGPSRKRMSGSASLTAVAMITPPPPGKARQYALQFRQRPKAAINRARHGHQHDRGPRAIRRGRPARLEGGPFAYRILRKN